MARKKTGAGKTASAKTDRETEYQPPAGNVFSTLMDFFAGRFPLQSEVLGEVYNHLRNAELEFLKALQVLVERQIERLETSAEEKRPPRVRKVDIR